jgi:hypothetical protein
MNTIFLLNDETGSARPQLQDAPHGKATVRDTEAVAGCNCDRWGHPCLGCKEREMQPKADVSIISPVQK